MLFDLTGTLGSQSLHKVFVKQLADEIFSFRGDHSFFLAYLWPLYGEVRNIVDDLLYGICAERSSPDKQLICHDA